MTAQEARKEIIDKMTELEMKETTLSIKAQIPLSTIRSYLRGGDTTTNNYLRIKQALGL